MSVFVGSGFACLIDFHLFGCGFRVCVSCRSRFSLFNSWFPVCGFVFD